MTTLALPFAPLAPVRSDTLPENMSYRDDGCDISHSCLACPLAVCKFDDPGWLQRENRRGRDIEMLRLRGAGVPVPEIARRFNVSTRTVHRVVRRGVPPPAKPDEDDGGPLMSLQDLARRSLFRRRTPWPPLFRGA